MLNVTFDVTSAKINLKKKMLIKQSLANRKLIHKTYFQKISNTYSQSY